ncbi:MAG: ThuA domain-containing protein [Myxococcota bacterium]
MVARPLDVVLGGSWHDFAGFVRRLESITSGAFACEMHFDPSWLRNLSEASRSLLLYTCFDEHTPLQHDSEQLRCLSAWLRAGGGLVALHASTVAARVHPELGQLLGGSFVSHPPKQPFLVRATHTPHPITAGIAPFEVVDERYQLEVDANVEILLVSELAGETHPVAWTRYEGAGRIFYFSLGHDKNVWDLPQYEKILQRGLEWIARR